MNKGKILEERLQECDVSITEILDRLKKNVPNICTVVLYISRFEGVGNKYSDFDIYVISDQDIQRENYMLKIKGSCCDVEYWSLQQVKALINNRHALSEPKTLKFIKRLKLGEVIFNEGNGYYYIKELIEKVDIDKAIYDYFKMLANAEYDDAVKMYKNEDYIASLLCCQRSMDNFIASLNAKNGHGNLNIKWAPRIFINEQGYGNIRILDQYMQHRIYCSVDDINIGETVEKIIDFLTVELNSFSLF